MVCGFLLVAMWLWCVVLLSVLLRVLFVLFYSLVWFLVITLIYLVIGACVFASSVVDVC